MCMVVCVYLTAGMVSLGWVAGRLQLSSPCCYHTCPEGHSVTLWYTVLHHVNVLYLFNQSLPAGWLNCVWPVISNSAVMRSLVHVFIFLPVGP